MRTHNTTFTATLAVLVLLLLPTLTSAELVINRHSIDFTAESPYNEQLKLCAGEVKVDEITVRNIGDFASRYRVEMRTNYPGDIRIGEERFDLEPGRSITFPIYIERSAGIAGTFPYEVTISDDYGRIELLQRTIDVRACQTVTLDVDPTSKELGLCEPTSIGVRAQNIGPYEQEYALAFGPYESIVQADRRFTLAPGATRDQEVNITFPCDTYGARTLPIVIFNEDGTFGAQASIAFSIRNEYDLALELPTSATVCAASSTDLELTVRNLGPVPDDMRIELDAPDFITLPDGRSDAELSIGGTDESTLPLTIDPSANDLGGHRIGLTIMDRYGGIEKSRDVALTVERCFGPRVELRTTDGTPITAPLVACCGDASYAVNVRNDGTREQVFALSLDGPSIFRLAEQTVRARPGENVDVRLDADLPCADETYQATITVAPVGESQINTSATLTIQGQTQRTCHAIAIDDDELRVRDDATSVPVIVKSAGIAGGTYRVALEHELFRIEETELTLVPGQQRVIHLVPRSDLVTQPKGRYIIQPSFTLDSQDIDYEEHVGITLDGRGRIASAVAWVRGLPWCAVGTCGWTLVTLWVALALLLIALLLIYAGKLTLFPDGLPRRTLGAIKTLLVIGAIALLALLTILGTPPFDATHERIAQDTDPTVIEWYQDTPHSVDLSAYFTDPDKDALTYGASQPAHITARIDGPILTLVPDTGFAGEDRIVVTASDEKGAAVDSPSFTLRVIARKELGILGTVRAWCKQLLAVTLLAIIVVLLLVALGIKERRPNDPRDNVLVVVPRPTRKKIARRKKSARGTVRRISVRVPARAVRAGGEAAYIATKDGSTVHSPDCVVARRIPKGKRVTYATKGQAVKAKLVPCRLCRPFEGGI